MPRSSDYLPMPALVWSDAAELVGGLEVRQMFLDGTSSYAKRGDHAFLGNVRMRCNERQQPVNGLLTVFSDRFFLTAFF